MIVRPARPADADAISLFAARTFHEAFAADNRPEDMLAYMTLAFGPVQQQRELSDPRHCYLLAEEGSTLAGYALLRDGDDTPDGVTTRPSVELVRFYVDRPWHGKGVATSLMDACEHEARRRGARGMWLGVWERNYRAVAFYRKRGFRDVGSHAFVLGDDVQTDRVMEREV